MLTYFQAEKIIDALNRSVELVMDYGSDEDLELMNKSKAYLIASIKEGKMPIGDHEDDIQEESEPDMRDGAMRMAYMGR